MHFLCVAVGEASLVFFALRKRASHRRMRILASEGALRVHLYLYRGCLTLRSSILEGSGGADADRSQACTHSPYHYLLTPSREIALSAHLRTFLC